MAQINIDTEKLEQDLETMKQMRARIQNGIDEVPKYISTLKSYCNGTRCTGFFDYIDSYYRISDVESFLRQMKDKADNTIKAWSNVLQKIYDTAKKAEEDASKKIFEDVGGTGTTSGQSEETPGKDKCNHTNKMYLNYNQELHKVVCTDCSLQLDLEEHEWKYDATTRLFSCKKCGRTKRDNACIHKDHGYYYQNAGDTHYVRCKSCDFICDTEQHFWDYDKKDNMYKCKYCQAVKAGDAMTPGSKTPDPPSNKTNPPQDQPYTWTPDSSGTYTGGTYTGGTYTGGTYTGGTYTGGTYSDGTYSGGTYTGGTYSDGTYSGGTYTGGTYSDGTYSGGTYTGGTYSDGTYSGGTYSGGTYTGGTYSDGTYTGGTYTSGTYATGGTYTSGTYTAAGSNITAGTYTGGTYSDGTYTGGTYSGTYSSGTYSGTYSSGTYTGGTYTGGTYSGGTYTGGTYSTVGTLGTAGTVGIGTGGTYSGGTYSGTAYSGGTYSGTYSSGTYSDGTYSGGTYSTVGTLGTVGTVGTYSGTYSSGTYSSGTYSGTYSSGTYSSGTYSGTYSSGTYSGTYSSGSYSSGLNGGSSYSGTYSSGSYSSGLNGGSSNSGTYSSGSYSGGTYSGNGYGNGSGSGSGSNALGSANSAGSKGIGNITDAIEKGASKLVGSILPGAKGSKVVATGGLASAGLAIGAAAIGGGLLLAGKSKYYIYTPEDFESLNEETKSAIINDLTTGAFSAERIEIFKNATFRIKSAELNEHVRKVEKAYEQNIELPNEFREMYGFSLFDSDDNIDKYLLFVTMIIDGANTVDDTNIYNIINPSLDEEDVDFIYFGINMEDYFYDKQDEEETEEEDEDESSPDSSSDNDKQLNQALAWLEEME